LQTIAFLGLGIMGGSMAANLARNKMKVLGWNRTPGRRPGAQRAEEAGVKLVATAAEAVADADLVFLCLSDVCDLKDMLFGEKGIASRLQKGTVVIDTSTTGPECAREVHKKLRSQGVFFLDAPVSGGDIGARNGTLTVMVGGDEEAYAKALPAFEAIGKNIRHCGPAGAGQAVKLCNQVLCAVNMVAVCEAFRLAEEMSIDPNLVVEVCGTGAAGSWALSNLGPRILRDEMGPGFMIEHMLKDLRLVEENFPETQHELPGTALAERKFRQVESDQKDGGRLGTHAMMLTYGAKDKVH
jgi:3-hydroxyisobutyrate dehydrogenase